MGKYIHPQGVKLSFKGSHPLVACDHCFTQSIAGFFVSPSGEQQKPPLYLCLPCGRSFGKALVKAADEAKP